MVRYLEAHFAKAVVDTLRDHGYEIVSVSGAPLSVGGPYHLYAGGGSVGAGTYVGQLARDELTGTWEIEPVARGGPPPVQQTEGRESRTPTTTAYVAYCPASHPPDQPGVTAEGTWYGQVWHSDEEARADVADHGHGEAYVLSYTLA